MTTNEWQQFEQLRTAFKNQCMQWLNACGYAYSDPSKTKTAVEKSSKNNGILHTLQKKAAEQDGTPHYPIETPIVYNHTLDAVTASDTISLIVIGDNPGKNEQLHTNQRYLVGQAGKVAEGFFRRHPELHTDFRKNAVIMNKSPIHTAKTKQLGFLLKNSSADFAALFEETQRITARYTVEMQKALGCEMWLVGYGELRKKSLFTAYADELKKLYAAIENPPVYVFQHFSMNCFSNDLKKRYNAEKTLNENLHDIGLMHRKEILGW